MFKFVPAQTTTFRVANEVQLCLPVSSYVPTGSTCTINPVITGGTFFTVDIELPYTNPDPTSIYTDDFYCPPPGVEIEPASDLLKAPLVPTVSRALVEYPQRLRPVIKVTIFVPVALASTNFDVKVVNACLSWGDQVAP